MIQTKHLWLTNAEVVQKFGFDPTPYEERQEAGNLFITNALDPRVGRIWLETDCADTAIKLRNNDHPPRNIREKIDKWVKDELERLRGVRSC